MSKESEYIHKRHNVSVMIYHFVCPAKYRRVVFDEVVDILTYSAQLKQADSGVRCQDSHS